jgi:hypothetical protein
MNTTRTNCARTELPTVGEITREFVEAELQKKRTKSDGQNCSLADCLHVAQAIVTNFEHQTFSLNDFIIYSGHLEIPLEKLKDFFAKWVKMLSEKGRCTKIEGCYEFPVYQLI